MADRNQPLFQKKFRRAYVSIAFLLQAFYVEQFAIQSFDRHPHNKMASPS
jgi:hypothetical protein